MDNLCYNIHSPEDTMSEVIYSLQKAKIKLIVIIDNKKLVGTITDGDIRRALLKSLNLENKCSDFMNTSPHFALKDDHVQIDKLLSTHKNIPIVDDKGYLVDIISSEYGFAEKRLKNQVVIMAGGKGERLHPLTLSTPKPLLPLDNKPIIHKIIERLVMCGLNNINISVFYKAEMLKDYFKNEKTLDINVSFLEEKKPLGTAGCLYLMKNTHNNEPVIVINGDILTEINYSNLLTYHKKSSNKITICASFYETEIPFGTLEVENNIIKKISEKPIKKFLINAGIYVLDPDVINTVKNDEYLNMPDLINHYIANDQAGIFPLHEEWIDIGSHDDYEKANQ